MATGNHGLLHIHPVNEQLTDCPAITTSCDPADAYPLIDQQSVEVIFATIAGTGLALFLSSSGVSMHASLILSPEIEVQMSPS